MNPVVPSVSWREADVIHALRVQCGWQVQELADRAGLNPSVIYRLEDGRVQEPKTKTLAKLAAAFNLTVQEIRNAVPRQPIAFARDLPATTAKAPQARKAPPAKKKSGAA